MAHIVTLNNGKNITMSVATDESLWLDLSYYIRKEMGEEFYSYLISYMRFFMGVFKEVVNEFKCELEYKNAQVKEIQSLLEDSDIDFSSKDSALKTIENIIDYVKEPDKE